MEQLPLPEMTPRQNEEYIRIQVALVKLMLSLGAIKSVDDYVERFAPMFEMIIRGQVYIATNAEIEDMRGKIRNLAKNQGT